MPKDIQNFRKVITSYLQILEELTINQKFRSNDPKYLAQLRTAERSFNFLLDQFPDAKIEAIFGSEEWSRIKSRRNRVAQKISAAINSSSDIRARYVLYCEHLKDPTRHSSTL
jgi:hypothetical protein